MPHTDVRPTYQLTLNDREFRLVTMSLAGIVKDEQDRKDSLALNAHLCHQRSTMLKGVLEVAEKASQAANKMAETE